MSESNEKAKEKQPRIYWPPEHVALLKEFVESQSEDGGPSLRSIMDNPSVRNTFVKRE